MPECACSICRQTQKPPASFLSSLFPVRQLHGFVEPESCHTSVSSILLTTKSNPLTVHSGWTGLVSSCSIVFLLFHLLQGYYPVKMTTITGTLQCLGKWENWWQRTTKEHYSPAPMCRKMCGTRGLRNTPIGAFTLPSPLLNTTFLPVAYF